MTDPVLASVLANLNQTLLRLVEVLEVSAGEGDAVATVTSTPPPPPLSIAPRVQVYRDLGHGPLCEWCRAARENGETDES